MNNKATVEITIYNLLTPEAFEKLEGKIFQLLTEEWIEADINNLVTGNSMSTHTKK